MMSRRVARLVKVSWMTWNVIVLLNSSAAALASDAQKLTAGPGIEVGVQAT